MSVARVARAADRQARAAARRSAWAWRYGLNAGPTRAYRRARRTAGAPGPEAARLLGDLDRDGIAVTTLDELVGPVVAADLLRETTRVRDHHRAAVEEARSGPKEPGASTQKPFLLRLLDDEPSLDPDSPLTRFALDPRLLEVVHGYFGMFVRLRYQDIWHTLITGEAPSQSQLWHRDPEDRLILKVFVALEDVTDGSGPFHYAPGTHAKGAVRRRPAHVTLDGPTPRSTDEQMAAVVPAEHWRTAIGPTGTVVLADTRGYHKGGHALASERVLFVSQYLSRAAGRGGLRTDRVAGLGAAPPGAA